MISPYFSGGGGGANFGPPPGLANLLATKAEVASREQQDGIQNLGKVLSYFANQGAEGAAATGTYNAMLASQRDAVLARAVWEKALGTGVIP